MNKPATPVIIEGCPRDKWAEVQAIQDQPFIYVMHNGSRWAGEKQASIADLIKVLENHPLDAKFGTFYTVNPCEGVRNPDYPQSGEEWIDGGRFYACEAVRFFGNFADLSHGFSIDTNDKDTIAALTAAIDANIARQHRKAA